jgi:hypothetical protein
MRCSSVAGRFEFEAHPSVKSTTMKLDRRASVVLIFPSRDLQPHGKTLAGRTTPFEP